MANLIIIRHGESEWNAKGLWTGLTDVSLNQKGIEEAKNAGKLIQHFSFDKAFTSKLKRAIQTLEIVNEKLDKKITDIFESVALNERNYGILTGKNKWEIKKEKGEKEFLQLRRGWDYKIPEGESLKDVYNRVIPYYDQDILPELKSGNNILVVAHGNSLRALVKHIENISDTDIVNLNIELGSVYLYEISSEGKITKKTVLQD